MRKSHRNPSLQRGVQKFEGEGVMRHRNVIEKSYGSDTGNPAKEMRHSSGRKPKEDIIKALRLTRGEQLELQPRKGKKDVRSELPKKRATGGRVNRAEADRHTEDLNSSTSPYKGYEPKAPPVVDREIRAPKLAAKRPVSQSEGKGSGAGKYLRGQMSPLKKEMLRVEPYHPDRQERKEEHIISRSSEGEENPLHSATHKEWMRRFGRKTKDHEPVDYSTTTVSGAQKEWQDRHGHKPKESERYLKGDKTGLNTVSPSHSEWMEKHGQKPKARSSVDYTNTTVSGAQKDWMEKHGKKHGDSLHRSRGGKINSNYGDESDSQDEGSDAGHMSTDLKTSHGRKKPFVSRRPSEEERQAVEDNNDFQHETHHKRLRTGGSAALKPIKIKHPGALHKQMGIPQGKKIPKKALLSEKHSSNPLTRKRATFALNARKWNHE